ECNGKWQKSYEWTGHEASVNAASFAPHKLSFFLATASADPSIEILELNAQNAQWVESRVLKAHELGVNAISWSPPQRTIEDVEYQPFRRRFGFCGNSNLVKIWTVDEKGKWTVEKALAGHSDFAQD
ncbi:hypothetical protein Angca_008635, partial [Angiostrongylus cantonensis]